MFKRFCLFIRGKIRGRSRVNPHVCFCVNAGKIHASIFFLLIQVTVGGGVNPGQVTNQSQH